MYWIVKFNTHFMVVESGSKCIFGPIVSSSFPGLVRNASEVSRESAVHKAGSTARTNWFSMSRRGAKVPEKKKKAPTPALQRIYLLED
jgi:hypothetical protein